MLMAVSVIMSCRKAIRIVTSRHMDHTAACLKELSLPLKAPGHGKNPSFLWLKYDFNINKTGIFAFYFYILYFFQC